MKNHWLNKKKEKETNFDIELALELGALTAEHGRAFLPNETIQLEGESETPAASIFQVHVDIPSLGDIAPPSYHVSGIVDPALTTVQTVSCVDLPGVDWGVLKTPAPPSVATGIILNSYCSMSCTCMDFEPGQTALAELEEVAKSRGMTMDDVKAAAFGSPDLEVGDGSMKYVSEIKLGPFTFKDAGELGVDIFLNDVRLGWLNSNGEEKLVEWLKNKPKKNFPSFLGVVSNEQVSLGVKPDGWDGWDLESFYKIKHDNIVPESLIVTLNDKKVVVPSYGNEIGEDLASIGVKAIAVNYEQGNISIAWATPPGKTSMKLCYEYEVRA